MFTEEIPKKCEEGVWLVPGMILVGNLQELLSSN